MDIDTATATGKLLLTLMGGIASFERDLMLERQRCGIAAAKAAGKYRGRKPTARAKADEVVRMKTGGASVAEIVRTTGVSRASVYRIIEADPSIAG
jgi:DNA invertase Pin-like site-specific DNA recombinase